MDSVKRVKEICKSRRIPISKLERDLGYANGYIGQLRKGTFPANRLAEIAQYLSVSVDYLLNGENAPTQAGEREITFDDFSFAMHNHSGNLTDSDKETLLKLAQQLADANRKKKRNGETN